MKKYLIAIIAAILVVVSLFSTAISANQGVRVGAGNGENSKVEDMEDLYSLLEFIMNRKSSDRSKEINNGSTPLLLASRNSDDISSSENEHKSVTIIEDTVVERTDIFRTPYYNDYSDEPRYRDSGKSYVRLVRELKGYVTEDATYYISKGTLEKRSETYAYQDIKATFTDIYFDFDMHIYIGDNEAFIKINRYNYSLSDEEKTEEQTIRSEYVGKWIQLTSKDAISIFASTDDANGQFLSMIKELIEYGVIKDVEPEDEDQYPEFEREGDIYIATQEFKDEKDEKVTGDMKLTINLSEYKSPYLELKGLNEDGGFRSFMLDTITFCNIDNTIVDFNGECDYKFEDFEAFEKDVFK